MSGNGGTAPTGAVVQLTYIVGSRTVTVKAAMTMGGKRREATEQVNFGPGPLSVFAGAPLEVALAAVLPCFWVYKEVGDHIMATQNKHGNPYQAWIYTYGGEEFAASVRQAIAICDETASSCA